MGKRQRLFIGGLQVALIVLLALSLVPGAFSQETPRRGGELVYAVAEEPPSFDAHRETTFAMLHPIRPHYNLLVKFDLQNYPKVVGDVAESWDVSPDGLTFTFKIRTGIKFHDGSLLTAQDVKASYDKIIFPPPGVVSVRKPTYAMVELIQTPDDQTVVFRLTWPSASFLTNLASPFNWIYKADILNKDPRWYEKNVLGTGPFKFVEYARGSHWRGKRNEDYFVKDRPFLDSYRAIFIRETGARVAAVRGGRALIELRGFSPAHRDDLVRALKDKIRVQESPWLCNLTLAINNEKKPFDDVRVRRALTLALDRWEGAKALSRIAIVKPVGGVLRPGYELATPEEELMKLAGFGRDISAARQEARRLLKEAGISEGFKFTLKNRAIPMPYEHVGVFLIDQWRRVGLEVQHVVQDTGPYFADLRGGRFETNIDFTCDFMDEPDIQLHKFISTDKSAANYSRYEDRILDTLYERQSRTRDPQERLQLVRQFERRVLDEKAYQFHILWWYRIIPHWARLKGWKISPAHHLDPDLEDIWLAPES